MFFAGLKCVGHSFSCVSRIVVDPYVFGLPGSGSVVVSGSFPSASKKCKISTILWFLFDFLSVKTDVNVPSKSNRKKLGKKTYFLSASSQPQTKKAGSGSGAGSVSQWYGPPDPDQYQNVTDPQHWTHLFIYCVWIRTKEILPWQSSAPATEPPIPLVLHLCAW